MGGCLGGSAASAAGAESDDDVKAPDQEERKAAPPPKKKIGKGKDLDYPFVDGEHNLKNVWEYFTKERVLGQGASCEVCHVVRKEDNQEFAMKVMVRDDKWNPILFKQEVDLLQTLNHKNILKYRDCYMDNKNFYVCTELCKGGELFDKIKTVKKFTERQAAQILKTIVSAIDHCHQKNIVHRDLKPENIVYRTKAQEELVIIDFGDAKKIDPDATYEDFVGTAFYLAPECVRNRQGWELKKSDMWTIGVIAYVLLTGRPPFYGKGNKEILKKIIRSKVTFPKSCKLSRQAIDFILKLVKKSPAERMSASDALEHEWLAGNAGDVPVGSDVLEMLGNYSQSCKLKKVLVRMLANQMTDEDHKQLTEEFAKMDKDGNGMVDLTELTNFIMSSKQLPYKIAHRRASKLMAELDQDGDGLISVQEFADARLSTKLHDQAVIKKQFQQINTDGSGFITSSELASLFNWTLSEALIKDMIREIDANDDGKISFEEFKAAMQKGHLAVFSPRKPITSELTGKLRKEFENELKNEGTPAN